MSWPLLPEPTTRTFLRLHLSPSSAYWLEWAGTAPPKLRNVGISGRLGIPLTPVAMTTCRGVHLSLRAVSAAEHHRPSALLFVVRAALEFGGRPIVELHAFHIGLEPSGNFVFGNIGQLKAMSAGKCSMYGMWLTCVWLCRTSA